MDLLDTNNTQTGLQTMTDDNTLSDDRLGELAANVVKEAIDEQKDSAGAEHLAAGDGATEAEAHDDENLHSDNPEDWGLDVSGMQESQTEDEIVYGEVDQPYTMVDNPEQLPDPDPTDANGQHTDEIDLEAIEQAIKDDHMTIGLFTSLAEGEVGISDEEVQEIRDRLGKSDSWDLIRRTDGRVIWKSTNGMLLYDSLRDLSKVADCGCTDTPSDDVSDSLIEINEYYLVWVDDPDQVPADVSVQPAAEYDGEPPADESHFYEVPFDGTMSRVDIGERKEALAKIDDDPEFPTVSDLKQARLPYADEQVAMAVQQGEHHAITKSVLEQVRSPLTLVWLSKQLVDEPEFASQRQLVTMELKSRGIHRVEKIVRGDL